MTALLAGVMFAILLTVGASTGALAQAGGAAIVHGSLATAAGASIPLPSGGWRKVARLEAWNRPSAAQGVPFVIESFANADAKSDLIALVVARSAQTSGWTGSACGASDAGVFIARSMSAKTPRDVEACATIYMTSLDASRQRAKARNDGVSLAIADSLDPLRTSLGGEHMLTARVSAYRFNETLTIVLGYFRTPSRADGDAIVRALQGRASAPRPKYLAEWSSRYMEALVNSALERRYEPMAAYLPPAVSGEPAPLPAAAAVAGAPSSTPVPPAPSSAPVPPTRLASGDANREEMEKQLADMRRMVASLKEANEAAMAAAKRASEAAQAAERSRDIQAAERARDAQAAEQARDARASDSAPGRVLAERRALVIGNDAYVSVARLDNAGADARAVARALETAGYRVSLKLNLREKEFKQALREFRLQVQGGDEVLLFYAGHGVQLGSANYLIPVDLMGKSEEQIRDDAIELQRVLDDLRERKAKFTLAVIDACRDNPFRTGARTAGSRGLAPTTAATGQVIMFSAGSGQQALDRLGPADRDRNSVFTRVLLREMLKPGVPVDKVLRNVRNEVVRLAAGIGHEQTPAIYDQAVGEFFFRP